MKKIYICIGVNGSGKTTYVQKKLNLCDKKQEIDFNKLFTILEQTLEN